MSVESNLFDALKGLVSNRCYPDVAPSNTVRPFITFQQVGGTAANFLETAVVGLRNARFQVTCWADTRVAAAALARSAEDAMVTSTALRAYVLGAMVADYEEETHLFGTRQDFTVFYS